MGRKKYELAWAAGFFDGEGCIRSRTYEGKKYAVHCQVRLSISQAEPELLYRFKALAGGVGSVNGPYKNKGKGVYHYSLTGVRAVELMQRLYPYLGTRKRVDFDRAQQQVLALHLTKRRKVF